MPPGTTYCIVLCIVIHSKHRNIRIKNKNIYFQACEYKELMLALGTILVLSTLSGSAQSYPTWEPSPRTVF